MDTLGWILLISAGSYIAWLQLQLYVHRRIVRAFQASAIVVPAPQRGSGASWFWLGLLLLAGAAAIAAWR